MPIHDWARVDAGIFHDFHHAWIEEIKRALNAGLLPDDYYAMAEQQAGGFGPDVLTLQGKQPALTEESTEELPQTESGVLVALPQVRFHAESVQDFYRRKQSTLTV